MQTYPSNLRNLKDDKERNEIIDTVLGNLKITSDEDPDGANKTCSNLASNGNMILPCNRYSVTKDILGLVNPTCASTANNACDSIMKLIRSSKDILPQNQLLELYMENLKNINPDDCGTANIALITSREVMTIFPKDSDEWDEARKALNKCSLSFIESRGKGY
jgi:hypothetical protein